MASLATLDPKLRATAETFYRIAHSVLPGLVVTSARRSWFEQSVLYAKYLAKKALEGVTPMSNFAFIQEQDELPKARETKILPAAPPGYSKHELGLAFDIARLNVDPFRDEALPILGSIWKRIGGIWRPSDPVHFEV